MACFKVHLGWDIGKAFCEGDLIVGGKVQDDLT
jgi:hypothetical protein